MGVRFGESELRECERTDLRADWTELAVVGFHGMSVSSLTSFSHYGPTVPSPKILLRYVDDPSVSVWQFLPSFATSHPRVLFNSVD